MLPCATGEVTGCCAKLPQAVKATATIAIQPLLISLT
jgi:hypothetical protein